MKGQFSAAAAAALLASGASAQFRPAASSAVPNTNSYGAPSCVSTCFSNLYSTQSGGNWMSALCGNETSIATINSCIDSSSCDASDKTATYQVIAQICANAGYKISASQEATFSATSGGSAYPTGTNSAWASYASQFSTLTTAPSGAPAFVTAAPNNTSGWNGRGGYGPFGYGGNNNNNGWGPWASQSSGAWTTGPWTSWWGNSACPPSTWSGWTSGPWGTNAPWTTWTGCSASTTATSVITTTVTSGSSASVVTTTAFGVQVAQASNAASSATGAAASATSSKAAAGKNAVVSAGVGLGGLVAAVLAM